MNQTTHPELLEILRIDYQRVLAEIGMKPEQVRAMVENESDQMPMPPGFEHLEMRPSPIQGRGMFTTKNFTKGQRIGPGNVGGMRTPLGRYMNHSPWPNTEFRVLPDGGIDAYALEDFRASRAVLK